MTFCHNEIANVIIDKFNVSSELIPLDLTKLPAFLPAPNLPPYLCPWDLYAVCSLKNKLVKKSSLPLVKAMIFFINYLI